MSNKNCHNFTLIYIYILFIFFTTFTLIKSITISHSCIIVKAIIMHLGIKVNAVKKKKERKESKLIKCVGTLCRCDHELNIQVFKDICTQI